MDRVIRRRGRRGSQTYELFYLPVELEGRKKSSEKKKREKKAISLKYYVLLDILHIGKERRVNRIEALPREWR